MSDKIVYQYTDDSFWASNGCDCCEDTPVECYNAVGWSQNGSAHALEDLYADVLWSHICMAEGVDIMSIPLYNPFYVISLQELKRILKEWDIVVEEVIV